MLQSSKKHFNTWKLQLNLGHWKISPAVPLYPQQKGQFLIGKEYKKVITDKDPYYYLPPSRSSMNHS